MSRIFQGQSMGDGNWLPVIKGQHMIVCMSGYIGMYQAGWHRRLIYDLMIMTCPSSLLAGTGFFM